MMYLIIMPSWRMRLCDTYNLAILAFLLKIINYFDSHKCKRRLLNIIYTFEIAKCRIIWYWVIDLWHKNLYIFIEKVWYTSVIYFGYVKTIAFCWWTAYKTNFCPKCMCTTSHTIPPAFPKGKFIFIQIIPLIEGKWCISVKFGYRISKCRSLNSGCPWLDRVYEL